MAKLNFKAIQGRVMSAAGLVAGSVASNYAGTTIDKLGAGKVSPLVNAGIRLGIAAALPSILGSKGKAGFMHDFSNGMMAQAGVAIAKELKIPGISGTDVDNPISDNWAPSGSLSGTPEGAVVSGAAN